MWGQYLAHLYFYNDVFKGMNMLKIAIASLFNKNKKYSTASKIQGSSDSIPDGVGYWC